MWIIIKSLLSTSHQWFKGNAVKCVLVLHKWDLNVWYDFRQSIPIFVLLNPDIYANFFLFQIILRLLFICPHITDITEINPWAFPCGVFIFYKWENVITKSRLNWITGYCIVTLWRTAIILPTLRLHHFNWLVSSSSQSFHDLQRMGKWCSSSFSIAL